MNNEQIKKKLKKAISDKHNVVIEISGGCLTEVHNIPKGYTYELIDHDNLQEEELCANCEENTVDYEDNTITFMKNGVKKTKKVCSDCFYKLEEVKP